MSDGLRTPRRIALAVLCEIHSELRASASAITIGRDYPASRFVNYGYAEPVIDYLASPAIRTDVDYRRAISTADEPRFWRDVSDFTDSSIAQDILLPQGYSEGTSIRLGDTGGILHVSFRSHITSSMKNAMIEFAHKCTHAVGDEIAATDIRLSTREIAVLELIAMGATNNEIADALCISRRTVATHVEHILAKTDSKTRAHASAKAVQLGLIEV